LPWQPTRRDGLPPFATRALARLRIGRDDLLPVTERQAAARAEALGRIWAYSRRQQSWFRKLGVSRIDRRSAVTAPELEIALAQDRTTIYHADGK
jgi:hypothetical protein